MCRSFNQKCPTAICKTLGAFKLDIKRGSDKPLHEYVILMENLNLGMDAKSPHMSKYDLKGSMLRRYVVTKDKTVTKLDTNFIEDNNSKPICMNYTLHRLMEIAIHNDTNFLSRYEKIDYSFLVWIDHENLLIRVGIIDYIQYYSFAKMLEHQVKKTLAGKAPTILDPFAYKQRFKQHMNNYMMSILGDQPIESFSEISMRQI
jgi:1-phosphatidylinositol-3-phosphate 5-kinase